MANASARLTIGALFGAVTTAANSVTSLLDVTTDGVGMIQTFVNDAATKQSIRSIVDMENFEQELQESKAQEMAVRKLSVVDFVNKSENHKLMYQESYDKIGVLLKNRRDRVSKAA